MSEELRNKLAMNLQMFGGADPAEDNTGSDDGTVDDDVDVDEIVKDDDKDKTFTQDEMNDIIKQRLTREQVKWEETIDEKVESKITERQKLSEMSEDEQKEAKLTELEKSLAEREDALNRKELYSETEQVLRQRELPPSFAKFLLGEDDSSTLENVKEFQEAFNDAVKNETKTLLSGETPRSKLNRNQTITKAEILKTEDSVKRLQLIRDNPGLFK